jgi:hypothetical protein
MKSARQVVLDRVVEAIFQALRASNRTGVLDRDADPGRELIDLDGSFDLTKVGRAAIQAMRLGMVLSTSALVAAEDIRRRAGLKSTEEAVRVALDRENWRLRSGAVR